MSCLTCAFDKKKALRKLEASEGGSTLTLPREEEARLLAELARGSSLNGHGRRSVPSANSASTLRDPHCIIAQDFVACVADEITVRRGDCVRELFRDGDWTYVATVNGSNGFVPSNYIKPIALLFHSSPAQEQLRAKTFERNSMTRASVDSRRSNSSASSWGSVDSRRKSPAPSGVSARELWVPPRSGKSETGSSQPASRAASPYLVHSDSQPSNGHSGSGGERTTSTSRPPSKLVTGNMDRPRPISCTPTHYRVMNNAEKSSPHSDRSATASPAGWDEQQQHRVMTRGRHSASAIPGELAGRRAKSMRNLRVNTAKQASAQHVQMAYHFAPNSPHDLSVEKGEEMVVLASDGEWLQVQTKSGKHGRVPKCMTIPMQNEKQGGVPNVEPLPADFIFRKPTLTVTKATARDSISTDITDDSAIATGDELSLSPSDSRRSSMYCTTSTPPEAGVTETTTDDIMAMSHKLGQSSGTISAHYSTTATRSNSPVGDVMRLPTILSPEPGMVSPNHSKSSSMSSTRENMLAQVRAREAVGDKCPRLVVMFDYMALVGDELDVKSGDIVMENPDRSKSGWAWVTLPRTNQQGYIPLAFTHPHGTELDDRQVTAL